MERPNQRPRRRSGAVVVLVAAGMTAFVMFAALVVDVGLWYHNKARTQMHADLAAIGALTVIDLKASYTTQHQMAIDAARELVSSYGYSLAEWSVTPRPNSESPAGTYVAAVTVVTTQPLPSLFWSAVSSARPTMQVRAIAELTRARRAPIHCGLLGTNRVLLQRTPARVLDSYDSRVGEYAPVNTFDGARYHEAKAAVCANANDDLQNGNKVFGSVYSAGAIDVHGGSFVMGDALAAGWINDNGGIVLGQKKSQQDIDRWIIPPVLPPPGIETNNDNAGNVTAVTRTGSSLYSGYVLDGGPSKAAWTKIVLNAGRTYYFQKAKMTSVPIEIDGDPAVAGPTRIYVDSNFEVASIQFRKALAGPGASLNGVSARDLYIGVLKTDKLFYLAKGAKNVADLHWPDGTVTMDTDTHFYGRVRTRDVNLLGQVLFTHDRALDPPPGEEVQQVEPHLVD